MENWLENKKPESALEKELTLGIGAIFDNADNEEGRKEGLNRLVSKLEPFFDLISEHKSQLSDQILDCARIDVRDLFTQEVLLALKPLIEIEATDPLAFEEERRKFFVKEIGSMKLSEILSYEVDDDVAKIHLSPAKEFIKEKGIKGFKEEVANGLISLAKIVEKNENIKNVVGISWIIAKNPTLLERLGFSVSHGEIPDEDNPTGGKRPISVATISRGDFLERYYQGNINGTKL